MQEFRFELSEALRRFSLHGPRNIHILVWPVKVYVRKSQRRIGRCLDLATIDVYEPSKGYGRETVKAFEEAAKAFPDLYECVFVENVVNDFLQKALVRYGYSEVPGDYQSMFKRV